MSNKKAILMILDGYGLGEPGQGNAIYLSPATDIIRLMRKYPSTTLRADGLSVGLPDGQMGNSEVGHLNLGAGKIIFQKLTLINKFVRDGDFAKNEVLLKAVKGAENSSLHIGGLCSEGGVHSSLVHLYEIVRVAKSAGIKNVYIHAFLDGRDTPPKSGLGFIREIEEKLAEIGLGKIITVSGRYFSMDRDNRWDRTEKAYAMLVKGIGREFNSATEAIEFAYENGETDEFVLPSIIKKGGEATTLKNGDSFIHFNFRPDRARQLTRVLTSENFTEFPRDIFPKLKYTCMAEYDSSFTLPIIITEKMLKQDITETLGSAVAGAGLTQLRIAETEKYAHVTYFLNGGREEPYKGEERIMVSSPSVATYDLQPEMSAPLVEEKLITAIKSNKFNLIVCNLANCDMVGHTGIIPAAIKAVSQVNKTVKHVAEVARENGYDLVIIADHGNAEKMLDENFLPFTAHTINPVPCIFVPGAGREGWELSDNGVLADVTGFMLYLLGIKIPAGMKKSVLLPE